MYGFLLIDLLFFLISLISWVSIYFYSWIHSSVYCLEFVCLIINFYSWIQLIHKCHWFSVTSIDFDGHRTDIWAERRTDKQTNRHMNRLWALLSRRLVREYIYIHIYIYIYIADVTSMCVLWCLFILALNQNRWNDWRSLFLCLFLSGLNQHGWNGWRWRWQ